MKNVKIVVTFIISFLLALTLGRHIIGTTIADVLPPQVSVTPAAQSVLLGSDATVAITISGAQSIGAYQFDINYDSAVVQVKAVNDGGWLSSTGRTVVPLSPVIDNVAGRTTVGAFSFGTQSGASGEGTLATFTLTTLSKNTSPITIQNLELVDQAANTITQSTSNGNVTVAMLTVSPSPIVSPPPSPVATPSLFPTATPIVSNSPTPSLLPSPTVTPIPTISPMPSVPPSSSPLPSSSATPAGQATLTLTAAPSIIAAGDEFVVTVALSAPQPVIGVDALVLFDPRLLAVKSLTDLHLLPQTPSATFNNGNGTVSFSQVKPPSQSFTGTGDLMQIHFKALVVGVPHIIFNYQANSKTESNVIAQNGNDILAQPEPLILSIVDPATMKLSLETYSENTILGHSVTGALTDTESTWSAQISTDASGNSSIFRLDSGFIGKVKTFVFKVVGYLTARFSKTITSGENSINLGKLRAGDLNDDGIINTIDLSLMYDQWFGLGGTADLNRDGVVNTADYFVITQNYLAINE